MLPLNPLAKVTDYQSMLRRIFVFTTIAGCGAVWLLRQYSPQLNAALAQLDFEVDLPYVKNVNALGYLLPSVVFAVFAYSIRLHDRLSDLFRIRYFFDTRKIIRPMAIAVGVDEARVDSLYTRRHSVMKAIFYKYASSTSPKIDTHSIHEALDNWTWFWVLLEAWFVFTCSGVAIAFISNWKVGLTIVGVAAFVLIVLSPMYLWQCVRYAKVQIDDILSDATRKEEIRQQLNAIQH